MIKQETKEATTEKWFTNVDILQKSVLQWAVQHLCSGKLILLTHSPGLLKQRNFYPKNFFYSPQKMKTKKFSKRKKSLQSFERTSHQVHSPVPPPKIGNFYLKNFLQLPFKKHFFKRKCFLHPPERTNFLKEKTSYFATILSIFIFLFFRKILLTFTSFFLKPFIVFLITFSPSIFRHFYIRKKLHKKLWLKKWMNHLKITWKSLGNSLYFKDNIFWQSFSRNYNNFFKNFWIIFLRTCMSVWIVWDIKIIKIKVVKQKILDAIG